MNRKAFTLSELIVTIVLIGVVLAISFPAITKLQAQNQKKIYETYETVLLTGAKLYVDQFSRDIWDNNNTLQCKKIMYNTLKGEDLIKEFKGRKKNEKVDSDNTYVIATKNNNSVTYEVVLTVILNDGIQTYPTENVNHGTCSNIY